MSKSQILENMKAELETAPKGSRGYVNSRRGRNIAWRFAQELFAAGVAPEEAYKEIFFLWKPFDAHLSKLTEEPKFVSLNYPLR